jgi:hypothetical protein
MMQVVAANSFAQTDGLLPEIHGSLPSPGVLATAATWSGLRSLTQVFFIALSETSIGENSVSAGNARASHVRAAHQTGLGNKVRIRYSLLRFVFPTHVRKVILRGRKGFVTKLLHECRQRHAFEITPAGSRLAQFV